MTYLLDALQARIGEFVALRRDLHQHPELAFEEHRTAALVAQKLADWGYAVTTGVGGTGVVGTLVRGTGPRRLGVRADMDALPIPEASGRPWASQRPGLMHACGHDGHTAMLLAAARQLAEEATFDGTLHLIFQPAEEGGGGALRMMADGLFERFPCDAVFAMHNMPGVPQGHLVLRDGAAMASSDYATITLTGTGGHGAMPQHAADPIVAAASLVMALQTVVSRNVDPLQAAVVTVGALHAGQANNVIPATATLELSVRALDRGVRALLERRVRALAEAQAQSFGVQATVDWRSGYAVLVNSPAETDFARQVATELVGADRVTLQGPPLTGSEDFAFMLERVPGSYLLIGNGDQPGGCMVHHPGYDFNDDNIAVGSAFWVRLAQRFLGAAETGANPMNVVILGAGLLGVTSAYYLRQLGHDVTVLDRQATPAAETSFANGGQISVSHAEPWANPGAPLRLLQWLGKEDAPLLFRLRADMRQWLWGLQFLRECTPGRTRHNIEQIVRLGTYSRDALQALRRERGLEYDQRTQGILHFYTSQKEFDGAEAPAAQMRALGCDRRVISADEAVAIEPALRHIRPQLAGATYTAEDESGDANQFARQLVQRCIDDGVQFRMSHTVTALREAGGAIDHVEATDAEGRFRRIRADAYLLAMGSLSPLLAAPLGLRLPIYPAKGYSVTMPVKDETLAHKVSLTDDEYKLVFSRLGNRLRIAGTAEFNGYDRDLNRVRCEAIVKRVEQLFPGAGDTSEAQFWTGLRPATPSNVPIIGRSKLPNLFLNTGHGTLGWTHACGSGKSIARIVSGLQPEVDFAFAGAAPVRQRPVQGAIRPT